MNTNKPNSYGLYDAPIHLPEQEEEVLTPEEVERLIEAGAFVMSREEAIQLGLLNPYDEPNAKQQEAV